MPQVVDESSSINLLLERESRREAPLPFSIFPFPYLCYIFSNLNMGKPEQNL